MRCLNFFHSYDWGFDTKYSLKKIKSIEYLSNNHFLHVKTFGLPIKRIFEIDLIGKYLVIVSASGEFGEKKMGFFNIERVSQLDSYDEYNQLRYSCEAENAYAVFIQQMEPCDGCFTGTITSNGKGRMIVELLEGTVDNRLLTSCGAEATRIFTIVFDEYELVSCNNFSLRQKFDSNLKKCMFTSGYFEFSYAAVSGENDIWFTYYSDCEIYRNILLDDFRFEKNVSDVCCETYLNNNYNF